MLRLFAKRWQRELYSDMVEVPSEHDSGCDLDYNLYLHFNYSIQKKRNFWKAKWVKERAKWVMGKAK